MLERGRGVKEATAGQRRGAGIAQARQRSAVWLGAQRTAECRPRRALDP